MPKTSVITLNRHIVDEERTYPEATGAFTNLLSDLALAAKIISREVNRAGLGSILGRTGEINVQGESVQKLDAFAQEVIYKAMDHGGHLCCMVSEECDEIIPIPEDFPSGEYVLLFDPLDGSSNIDLNVSIGSIFSIHRQVSSGRDGGIEDCLQPGHRQVAAGYVVYGSSTMLVYTTGRGVHGFTLDPSIGEFVLSHPHMTLPGSPAHVYSVNEAYKDVWSEGQRKLVEWLKSGEHEKRFSSRYIGSLVADFHRTLLQGGIFMYPADERNPEGKLRLLYEAAPLAMICSQAGGRASDGKHLILDLDPSDLHQRTPLYIGSETFVLQAERFLAEFGGLRLS